MYICFNFKLLQLFFQLKILMFQLLSTEAIEGAGMDFHQIAILASTQAFNFLLKVPILSICLSVAGS